MNRSSLLVAKHLLVILLLLLSLECGLGNTVQITLAGLGDAAATLVLVDLHDADLLERLEDLAVDGAGGVNVVGGAGATVLGGSVCVNIILGDIWRGRAYPWTLRRRPTPTVLRM